MRKTIVCLLVLALSAAGACADRLLLAGVSVSHGNETRESFPDFSTTSVGLHIGNFTGSAFGLYSTMALGYILGATAGGIGIDMDLYDLRLSVDAVLGLGYRIPVAGRILALVGAGLYVGVAAMFPASTGDPTYGGSFAMGPGVQASVGYQVAPRIHVGASLGVG